MEVCCSREGPRRSRLRLTAALDAIFDSHDEGVEKPDPRLFRLALERTGAEARTTVHVGDFYHVDVVGARAAGITPVLLDAADLYPDCDCMRVRSLTGLVEAFASGQLTARLKPRPTYG